MEQKTQIQTRTSPKQLNAFYAIQMRIHRAQIKAAVLQFGTLPITEASQVLGELMKQYPAPAKKALI